MAAPQRENSLEGAIHRGNLSGWNSFFFYCCVFSTGRNQLKLYKRNNPVVVTIGMCAWCDAQKLQLPEDSIIQELQPSRAKERGRDYSDT